jgi:imidazolonepropionase-like amidohydrolase
MKKIFLVLFTLSSSLLAFSQQTFHINGTHDNRHTWYAFIHARIYQDYATVTDDATLLVKDGKVIDAGTNVTIPEGSVVCDCKGKTIYPSFIDLYTSYGMPKPAGPPAPKPATQLKSATPGAYDYNQAIKSQNDAQAVFHASPVDAAFLRSLGFGAALTSLHDGIAQGSYALVNFADTNDNIAVIKGKAASGLSFNKGTSTQDYPASLMGAIALLRQTYLDAEWYKNAKHKTEFNISLDAFNNLMALPQLFMVNDKLSVFRADKVAREFKANYIIKGAGDEYQLIDEIKATGRQFIIPLNFPDKPKVQDPYDAQLVNLSALLNWEMAPMNPSVLEKAGITFALTTDGLKDRNQFWPNLRKAIQYGLSPQMALKAITYIPAQMMGEENEIGSLKKGMTANFIITSGDIFKNGTTIYSNWINGTPYSVNDTANIDIRGKYSLGIDGGGSYVLFINGNTVAPSATIINGKHQGPAYIKFENPLVTISFRNDGDTLHPVQLSGLIASDHKSFQGKGIINGTTEALWKATFMSAVVDSSTIEAPVQVPSMNEIRYPFIAYGRTKKEMDSLQKISKITLIKNATVWTGDGDSALYNTDVELKDGQITAIGKNLSASDATVVDGTGKFLTAGIIDEHSHIAVTNDVNEGTEACSAEVRIGDVLNSEDISIYRSLSGGVVACQVLHGSANPIGGQSGIIKLRWGMLPEQMKISYAVPFIKFALGENVKQSNWGDAMVVRYPQSRMGVEQFYYDRFTRAKEYEKTWEAYSKLSKKEQDASDPPRRDLRLETLAQIIDGKRFITCHSYVQSEMNMLLHVADSFHFRLNTFTHGLEAYKLADKIKARGTGVSTFADWWAYKMEVMEAIPYNAAITTKMGIVTAINSDDDEMQRRLNQEAAKTIKYGGLTEMQAWRTVTLNPAKLLHLDEHMGSIKVGKDADVVLWSGNPLSIYSKVEKTFVDGICEYDALANKAMKKEIDAERARLINEVMTEPKAPGKK